MFQRIQYEEWQAMFPIIGFTVFFLIFIAVCVRVWRMSRQEIHQLEVLPFESEIPRKEAK